LVVDTASGTLYKVSDFIPSPEEIIGTRLTDFAGDSLVITSSDLSYEDGCFGLPGVMMVVTSATDSFPETGIYFAKTDDAYISRLVDEKYQNGLDGSVIVAKSITAEKVSVSDLVAFGAKIADFTIEGADPDAGIPGKLYSYVKDSEENPTRGVYLDTEGQVAFGDYNNYLKFLKNEDGSYALEIRADKLVFGTGRDIQNELEDATTQIQHLNNVVEEVKGSYAKIVSNEDGTTSIVQSGTGYQFNFHDVTDLQNDMAEAKEHRSYINFEKDSGGNASIILHGVQTDDSGNITPGYKLKLTGNDMQFVSDKGKTVARIAADDSGTDDSGDSLLEIEKAKINTELRQGNFVWQARNGGNNFGLIWKG
jgi:hypothetical protein